MCQPVKRACNFALRVQCARVMSTAFTDLQIVTCICRLRVHSRAPLQAPRLFAIAGAPRTVCQWHCTIKLFAFCAHFRVINSFIRLRGNCFYVLRVECDWHQEINVRVVVECNGRVNRGERLPAIMAVQAQIKQHTCRQEFKEGRCDDWWGILYRF